MTTSFCNSIVLFLVGEYVIISDDTTIEVLQQYESQMITSFANLIQVPMEYISIVYEQHEDNVHMYFRYPTTPDVMSMIAGETFTDDLTSSLSTISGLNALLGYGIYTSFVLVVVRICCVFSSNTYQI